MRVLGCGCFWIVKYPHGKTSKQTDSISTTGILSFSSQGAALVIRWMGRGSSLSKAFTNQAELWCSPTTCGITIFQRGDSRASFFPPPCGDGGGFTALLSNDLPDVPLTQHNCFFVSTALASLVYGLRASVTVKRYTTAACKIRSNVTPSPEQLVSAVALLAGWLKSSWLPLAKPYAHGFSEKVCFTSSSLLCACHSSSSSVQ